MTQLLLKIDLLCIRQTLHEFEVLGDKLLDSLLKHSDMFFENSLLTTRSFLHLQQVAQVLWELTILFLKLLHAHSKVCCPSLHVVGDARDCCIILQFALFLSAEPTKVAHPFFQVLNLLVTAGLILHLMVDMGAKLRVLLQGFSMLLLYASHIFFCFLILLFEFKSSLFNDTDHGNFLLYLFAQHSKGAHQLVTLVGHLLGLFADDHESSSLVMDLVFGFSKLMLCSQLLRLLLLHVGQQAVELGAQVIQEWRDVDAVKVLVANAIVAHTSLQLIDCVDTVARIWVPIVLLVLFFKLRLFDVNLGLLPMLLLLRFL